MALYYSVVSRPLHVAPSAFSIEFGSYSKAEAKQERLDLLDGYMGESHEFLVIESQDDQSSIEAAVGFLNRGVI